MLAASEPRNDESRVQRVHDGLCGDFARGQRGELPSYPAKPCDFATGLRHRDAVPRNGSFATGMRSVSVSAAATGDFATGQRGGRIPTITRSRPEGRGWRLLISVLGRG